MYKDMIIGVIFKLKWRIIPVAVWNCCLFELFFHVLPHACVTSFVFQNTFQYLQPDDFMLHLFFKTWCLLARGRLL